MKLVTVILELKSIESESEYKKEADEAKAGNMTIQQSMQKKVEEKLEGTGLGIEVKSIEYKDI